MKQKYFKFLLHTLTIYVYMYAGEKREFSLYCLNLSRGDLVSSNCKCMYVRIVVYCHNKNYQPWRYISMVDCYSIGFVVQSDDKVKFKHVLQVDNLFCLAFLTFIGLHRDTQTHYNKSSNIRHSYNITEDGENPSVNFKVKMVVAFY